MKKQILSEEFLRMQKLAGLINENEYHEYHDEDDFDDENEYDEDFFDEDWDGTIYDTLINKAIKNNIISQEDLDKMNNNENKNLLDILFDVYEESGLRDDEVSSKRRPDYDNALHLLKDKLNK